MIRKSVLTLIVIILVSAVFAVGLNFFVNTDFFKEKAVSLVSNQLKTEVTISKLSVSVLPFPKIAIHDLSIQTPALDRIASLEFKKILIDIDYLSIFTGRFLDQLPDKIAFENASIVSSASGKKKMLEGFDGQVVSIRNTYLMESRGRVGGSKSNNLHIKGRLSIGEDRTSRASLDAEIQMGLDDIDLGPISLEGSVSGPIKVSLSLIGNPDLSLEGNLNVDIKRADTEFLERPVENIASKLFIKGNRLVLSGGSAAFGKGSMNFDAEAPFDLGRDNGWVSIKLSQIEASDIKALNSKRYKVYGTLDGSLEATFIGSSFDQVLSNLSGRANVVLRDAVVKNVNVLAMIFKKIAEFPMIGMDLRDRISPYHQAFLTCADMRVYSAEGTFSISQGVIQLTQGGLSSDHFAVEGVGSIALNGFVQSRLSLIMSPQLSYEMALSIPELAVLADSYGRLVFPFFVRGPVTNPKAYPDRDYIVARLVRVKGQEILQGIMDSDSGSNASNAADILSRFLR